MSRFEMPVAVHLFLLKDNKILMLRRFNTGYEDGNYSVCAGHLDGNEKFYEAMIRESKEELGIVINKHNLIPIQVMHRKVESGERIDYFFSAKDWEGEIKNLETNKCDELEWFDLNELPNNTIPYIKYAIEQYLKGKYFSDFGWEV